MLRRLTYLIVAVLFIGCYNATTPPSLNPELSAATTNIARLRAKVREGQSVVVEEEIIIRCRVTSSDRDNNFLRSMTAEDGSGGIEIMVGERKLHTTYPEGIELALHLKGCALGYRYGVLQVGSKADSYSTYDVDYLSTKVDINRVIERGNSVEKVTPRQRSVAELSKDMCGELTTINGLQLIESTSIDTLQHETLEYASWRGYALFCDSSNDTLMVYTRDDAAYANEDIPNGKLNLNGIVQYGKHPNGREYYQLKMRYAEDYTTY